MMNNEFQESIEKTINYIYKINLHIIKLEESYINVSERLAKLDPVPGILYPPDSHRTDFGESIDDLIRIRLSLAVTQKELVNLVNYLQPITTLEVTNSNFNENRELLARNHQNDFFEYNDRVSSIYKLLDMSLKNWFIDDISKLFSHYDQVCDAISIRTNQLNK